MVGLKDRWRQFWSDRWLDRAEDKGLVYRNWLRLGGLVCLQQSFYDKNYKRIAEDYLKQEVYFHRKEWEFVYIIRMLELGGKIGWGNKGLGFGCGFERLVPGLVSKGLDLVVTDLENSGWEFDEGGWDLYFENPQVCSQEDFKSKVKLDNVDMTLIPSKYLQSEFDFIWSSCSLEHLGGLLPGLDFVIKSLPALKVGGLAIHTTEFNVGSGNKTLDDSHSSIYRQIDFEWLELHLISLGCKLYPIDYRLGQMEYDLDVDHQPFRPEGHIKLRVEDYVCSSIGFAIEKVSD